MFNIQLRPLTLSLSPLALSLASCALVLAPSPASAQSSTAPLTKAQLLSMLDTDMAEVVLLYDAIKGTPAVDLTPQDARQQLAPQDAAKILARVTGAAEAPTPVGKVIDGMTIPGQKGTEIPIRIYMPEGSGPSPVIVYYHGGGFVVATINTYDESARRLCNYANAIVVSVEYRKAPEAPYPAAREDAIDAYKWAVYTMPSFFTVTGKVAVAGESAGGNLAAEVSIAARNQGLQMPTHQLLIYPVTSSDTKQKSDLLYTSSFLPLNTALLEYFFKLYVPDMSEANDPGVAPINANLKHLPPATILAAEEDPLVSDGQDYFEKLRAAGNEVKYVLYPGTTHEFFGMGAVVHKADQAERLGAARIAASF